MLCGTVVGLASLDLFYPVEVLGTMKSYLHWSPICTINIHIEILMKGVISMKVACS